MQSGSRLAWLLFGCLSLAAVATGCLIASTHGASAHVRSLNLAAWAAGLVLAVLLSRTRFEGWWPVLAPIGLVATFLFEGMAGVHRWIALGPVRLNAAELLLPATVVALAFDRRPLRLAIAVLVPLALQPDASQAVAFAGGAIAVLTLSEDRFLSAALVAALAALSFLKPDVLAPVPEVEGIIGLASPAMAALAVLALAGASLAPLAAARSPAAYGLAAYLVLAALAPVVGAFPVPLVGMGVSAILGTWLGFGALMGVTRRLS
ncbi:MAG: hypothetical protein JOZ72_19885 [Alphaproteobacteria bacterium]|nr:hypothetical protein [Alphaproteobacteria bacterium]